MSIIQSGYTKLFFLVMENLKTDTCEMCHKKEFGNPTMEKWSCYTLCTKCSDSVGEYISENIKPIEVGEY